MTKRASGKFERRPRDFYPTPPEGVRALLPHLGSAAIVYEPCAGAGDLVTGLRAHGVPVPLSGDIADGRDAFKITAADVLLCNVFVTNPPWTRSVLHPLIEHLSDILPTWLLLDADWSHTRQAVRFKDRCRRIVSVGRLRWIPGSTHTGYDNCAWYLFDRPSADAGTRFVWRDA